MKEQQDFHNTVKQVHRALTTVFLFFGLVVVFLVVFMLDPKLSFLERKGQADYAIAEVIEDTDEDRVENGIHVRTGLVAADGYMEVVNNCTVCHSAKLVIQNRMNAERWASTIDWMQQTQNLWDLGGNEEIIINYLVTNYPPQKIGRRAPLDNIEWYELKE